MTPNMIENAQICLSINNDDGMKKIIDIENLLHKHNTDLVLDLLQRIFSEYEHKLKQLVISDKTSREIDETVSRMFRVYMAIRAIERAEKEEVAA